MFRFEKMEFPFRVGSFKATTPRQNLMKIKPYIVAIISIGFNACVNSNQKQAPIATEKDSVAIIKTDSTVSIQPKETQFSLALSANAIQIINQANGSAKELGFERPFEQTIETVEKVLKLKPIVILNSECGAGPLKIASWSNGLSLIFRKKQHDGWLFAGWAANQAKNPELKLTTMAGIGVGSTRKDMEGAYVIKVTKTSLGYEFHTNANNLFGIFDGANEKAKITHLWSGVSCNFR